MSWIAEVAWWTVWVVGLCTLMSFMVLVVAVLRVQWRARTSVKENGPLYTAHELLSMFHDATVEIARLKEENAVLVARLMRASNGSRPPLPTRTTSHEGDGHD